MHQPTQQKRKDNFQRMITDLSKDVSGNASNANGVSNGGNKISGKHDKVNSDKLLEAQSRMVERYSSDYENFNPILQPSFANPLYQVRAASEEINLIYKVQSWKNDGNNANNNPGASQSVLKSLHVPLFHPSKRACCVCREEGEIEQILICSNCGMNTHANCYGASLESFDSSELPSNYKWYCDSCSNDLHPIYSTHYVCCLCTAKEVDYDSAIRGDKCSVPDSFKRTDSNRWCHAICSIFNEDCKYKDTSSMQPVIGTDLTILKNIQLDILLALNWTNVISRIKTVLRLGKLEFMVSLDQLLYVKIIDLTMMMKG
ncbi:unnamed protein product [[Candida] boidinii]|nr:unnamed protein product [[Candida] boidinii]